MKRTYSMALNAINGYYDNYDHCLKAIIGLLEGHGIDYVRIHYELFEPRCFNVHDIHGTSDLIVKVTLDKEMEMLYLYGESGEEYPIGKSFTDQDNYTICNLNTLVEKVMKEVDAIERNGIQIGDSKSVESLAENIATFIGEDGTISFEHGYKRPVFREGEIINMITSREIFTQTEDKHVLHRQLTALNSRELQDIIRAVNDYFKFIHNTVNCD